MEMHLDFNIFQIVEQVLLGHVNYITIIILWVTVIGEALAIQFGHQFFVVATV
jgi:hypothetical protein